MATELHRFEVRLIAQKDLTDLVPAQIRLHTDTAVSAFSNAVRSARRPDIFIRGRSSTGVYVETTDSGHAFLRDLPQVAMIVPPP